MTEDHRLANVRRQELRRQELRKEILACEGSKALDMILEAPSPATLIQSFPDQDLYYLMHKIGVHDFVPVLAKASSTQWEYILDVEIWDDDRMDLHLLTQVFSLLYAADPQRLLRWSIMEKPDFIEFFLFHNIRVVVREHDEPPPEDYDDYITLDDKFYFRFPGKASLKEDGEALPGETPSDTERHEEAPDLIERMLKSLAEMDLSVFHGLLLETMALLPTETEEEQFRLKSVRLAEKGFLPAHEAMAIYQPADRPRKRPGSAATKPGDPDQALPPQFFTQFIKGESLFVQGLGQMIRRQETSGARDIADLHNELAALINKIISADRIKIRKTQDLKDAMDKATAFLSLGIETLAKEKASPDRAAAVIEAYFLEDIFRAGSAAGVRIKSQARNWYEQSFLKEKNLPLSFLGEAFLGVIGGLLIERPMFFANYAEGVLYRHFCSLKDIRATERLLEEIYGLDDFLKRLDPDPATFTQGVLTYKSLILTLWAKEETSRTGAGTADLSPLSRDRFARFFKTLFTDPGSIGEERAQDLALWAAKKMETDALPVPLQSLLYSLIREVEEEYGQVTPDRIDPRFMPHFLVVQDDGDAD